MLVGVSVLTVTGNARSRTEGLTQRRKARKGRSRNQPKLCALKLCALAPLREVFARLSNLVSSKHLVMVTGNARSWSEGLTQRRKARKGLSGNQPKLCALKLCAFAPLREVSARMSNWVSSNHLVLVTGNARSWSEGLTQRRKARKGLSGNQPKLCALKLCAFA